MDADPYGRAPCSSSAVHAIIHWGTAGTIWGLCAAPRQSRKYGLTGSDRAGFLASFVARSTFQCAILGVTCASTHCALRRYRGKEDWVNSFVSGALAGAAVCAVTRSWRQLIPSACVFSAVQVGVHYGRKEVNTS